MAFSETLSPQKSVELCLLDGATGERLKRKCFLLLLMAQASQVRGKDLRGEGGGGGHEPLTAAG